jgi:chaperonin GroES
MLSTNQEVGASRARSAVYPKRSRGKDEPGRASNNDFEPRMETDNKMMFRPLSDRIVVKRIDEKETTRHGIIIPDSAKEKPQEGEVMAVGHGKRQEDGKLVALDVKTGDRVLFGKYSGSETKLDGIEYIVMREDDVLGVLDSAAKTPQKVT